MSFKNIEVTGEIKSVNQVEVTRGKFSEITLECGGETVTLIGKIRQIMRSNGVSAVASVEVTEPGGATFLVNSLNSDSLKNPDGSDRVETPGTKYKAVPGGKAYQEQNDLPVVREEVELSIEVPSEEEPTVEVG